MSKIQTAEKLPALETSEKYNGLEMSALLCLVAVTEKEASAHAGEHRLQAYLIMYTEESEKYLKFAYSYKTVNHTEQYHCSEPSSNCFLYFIGSINPITNQPKSCSYTPCGYSQLIDFFFFGVF